MRQRKFPDTLILLGSILIIFMALTWIIPAGEYARVEFEGRQVVDPDSFSYVEPNYQNPWHVLMAPLKGFEQAAYIIGFVFFIGGAFSIVNRTGAIHAGLMSVVKMGERHPRYRFLIIPLVMMLFSLGGATFGMAEEVLVFILITVPMARAMGYDTLVGVAIPVVGSFVGFAGAFANPFTIAIAQGIAGIDIFSGMSYRLLVWAVFTLTGIAFVMWYAARTLKRPEKSLMHGMEEALPEEGLPDEPLTSRRIGVLLVVLATVVMLVIGATQLDWYIHEITALFAAMAIAAALLYRLKVSDTVDAFYQGAKDMIVAAILIGFARSLLVVAEDGKIIDTILHAIATGASNLPDELSVQMMFIMQSGINILVPSGSGQAALTMPIMAPLSDLLGFTRQTAVLAYQFGDGITNLITPTSGLLMAILGISKIPYDRWFRFILPLVIILSIVAMLLLLPPVTFMEWN